MGQCIASVLEASSSCIFDVAYSRMGKFGAEQRRGGYFEDMDVVEFGDKAMVGLGRVVVDSLQSSGPRAAL